MNTQINITGGRPVAIYKRGLEVELGASENNIGYQSEGNMNPYPRPTVYKCDAPTTLSRRLRIRLKLLV